MQAPERPASFNDDDWYIYDLATKKVIRHYGSSYPKPNPKPGQDVVRGMRARWLGLIN